MKYYDNFLSIDDFQNQYLEAKKYIGICHEKKKDKILLCGENALDLINHYSINKVDDKITNNFYTILYKKKKYISEILVLRLSLYRFLIITDNYKKTYNILRKKKKKYPIVALYNATNDYSLFSFHGSMSNEYFEKIDYRYIFKTKHQNYVYYQLLCTKKETDITIKHFINLNFTKIDLEVRNIFLYNNNVVLKIDKIPKKYRISICASLYKLDNFRAKIKDLAIVKYELDGNFLVTTKHKIYSYLRKKAGIIHCTYKVPNKDNPFVIAFIFKNNIKKVSLIKIGKTDAFIRPILNY